MRLIILLSIVLFLSSTIQAKDKNLSISASIFNSSESRVLNNYLIHSDEMKKSSSSKKQKKQKKIPKGLQKKLDRGGSLPPGWQKKLQAGDVIDSSTYRYARPLPKEILLKLPQAPKGTIIVEIDGEIIRLLEASLTIIDILKH
ncbi:MAG: hypothetical protein ACI9N9_002469 [Enterobacterales bacterium]|jgi:hypothetical protein